ncbi:caspase family protein [uncultured Sunxiuqinia sp.]|uniref:caspase family protein n=1 Tax=uncultured Sunxiuqinia sp. TaxID=1573825 RepID=UPI002AA88106|nr:caspase family protein [uncultured Sunxiuqinia sp.]
MKKYVLLFLRLLIIASAYAQEDSDSSVLKLGLSVGHSNHVTSAEFSPNGKLILTASEDGTARIWDAETLALIHILLHADAVTSAEFSFDGKKILTASNNKVSVWNTESGSLIHVMENYPQALSTKYSKEKYSDSTDTRRSFIKSTKFSPDGKKIVTVSNDSKARVWDAETEKLLFIIEGDFGNLSSAWFSYDGTKIYTNSKDSKYRDLDSENYKTRVWDSSSGKLLNIIRRVEVEGIREDGLKILDTGTYKTRIWDIDSDKCIYQFDGAYKEFSPDGKVIITSSYHYSNNSLKAFNVETNELLLQIELPKVNTVNFSPDGKKIITTTYYNSKAKIWDIETGKLLSTLDEKFEKIKSIGLSANGNRIGINLWNNKLAVFDVETGKINLLKDTPDEKPSSHFFTFDEKHVLKRSGDKIKVFEAQTGELMHVLEGFLSDEKPDGKEILALVGNTVRVYEVKTGKLIRSLNGHVDQVTSAGYSPDGNKIITGATDNTVRTWNVETGEVLQILKCHSRGGNYAYFTLDGKKIVTASFSRSTIYDGFSPIEAIRGHDVWDEIFRPWLFTSSPLYKIRVWDAETGKCLYNLEDIAYSSEGVNFSPDGKKIVTSNQKKSAKILDANTGKLIHRLNVNSKLVNAANFSPEGNRVVTASDDNEVRIWDTETGELIHALEGRSKYIYDVFFSSDGGKVIAVGDNKTNIWNANSGSLIRVYAGTATEEKLFIYDDDYSAKINDIENDNDLFTLRVLDSINYIVYDQHYRFDGTENARKSLYFTCGLEIIKLEQVKDQLWVPNLAERIMKGESINSPKLEDLDLCNLIPEVENLETNNDNYSFSIKPRRGGLGESVLYVNNLEVKRYPAGQLIKQDGGFLLQVPASEVEPYFLPGEKNTVSVKAYTADNAIISRGAKAPSENNNLKKEPPEIYAVVVGVSDYKGEELDLRYPAKDAKKISAILESSSSKLFSYDGFDRVHLYLLQTDADRSAFPDKKSIKDTFTKIGKTAKSNDVLLIFFAGHGEVNKNDQQFYFLTADASVNSRLETVGISTKELFDWIQPANIKAHNRVLILDACNSGQAIKNIIKIGDADQQYMAARDDEYAHYRKELDKLNDNAGLFILSASASTQSAYEMNTYNQGILTYALLKPLKENPNILDADNLLSVSRWFEVAKDIVDNIFDDNLKARGFRQQPQLLSSTNFKIGVVDDEVRSKITLPKEKPTFETANFLYKNVPVDQIDFSKVVNDELNRIANENLDSPFIYFANNRSSESIKLSGNYLANDENITIYVYMSKNNRIIDRFEQSGPKSDLKKLAQRIIDEALLRLRK